MTILRSMLSLVVAILYLATSAWGIVHDALHASPERPRSTHATAGTVRSVGPCHAVDDAGAAHCFFCHHGPIVSIALAPEPHQSPVMTLQAIVGVGSIAATASFRPALPSLRAPPSRS